MFELLWYILWRSQHKICLVWAMRYDSSLQSELIGWLEEWCQRKYMRFDEFPRGDHPFWLCWVIHGHTSTGNLHHRKGEIVIHATVRRYASIIQAETVAWGTRRPRFHTHREESFSKGDKRTKDQLWSWEIRRPTES